MAALKQNPKALHLLLQRGKYYLPFQIKSCKCCFQILKTILTHVQYEDSEYSILYGCTNYGTTNIKNITLTFSVRHKKYLNFYHLC